VGRMVTKIFSFFSGIGFLDLGFEDEGFEVVLVNELSEKFMDGYQHSRKVLGMKKPSYGYHLGGIQDISNEMDLSSIVKSEVQEGNIVGFIAGPPCPDFSVGGKNRGREGEKGILSLAYFDLIIKYSPDFFLFENVKGLWRTKRHRRFYEELKERANHHGYHLTEKLANALEYGVPQDRDRIILFGFKKTLLDSLGYDSSLANENRIDFPWDKIIKYSMSEVAWCSWPDVDDFKEGAQLPKPTGIIEDLTVDYWFRKNAVHKHPNSIHGFKPRAGLAKFKIIPEGDDSKKSYKRLHRWRYSPTAAYGNNEVHLHPYKARRITVSEALAIQSMPKDFELPGTMSLTAMFKGVGNGVPYLMARGLAESLKAFLESES